MAIIDAENGRSVHYEHHAGAGRPVVLIHGWAMSGRAWAATTDTLRAAGHCVIVIDHRGCGRSDRDFADNSIPAIAGDVVAIVERHGLDGVVLNGWSLGGAVAIEAAHRLGRRVSGVVLTCGASPRYTQAEGFPMAATRKTSARSPVPSPPIVRRSFTDSRRRSARSRSASQ